MGKLAFYGAMAGLGKGWQEATIAKEDAKQKKLQRDHDVALQKLRMDFQNTLADKKMTQAEQFHEAEMGLREDQLEETKATRKDIAGYREDVIDIQRDEAASTSKYRDAMGDYYRALAEGEGADGEEFEHFTVKGLEGDQVMSFNPDTNKFYRIVEGVGTVEVSKADVIESLPPAEQALVKAPGRWQEYLEALKKRDKPPVLPPSYLAIHGAPEGYEPPAEAAQPEDADTGEAAAKEPIDWRQEVPVEDLHKGGPKLGEKAGKALASAWKKYEEGGEQRALEALAQGAVPPMSGHPILKLSREELVDRLAKSSLPDEQKRAALSYWAAAQ